MSVLQEILEKGYVDPEVLKQLGEEQKQILFIKMREEQLRKWRLREVELETSDQMQKQSSTPKNGGRRVQWVTGSDGDVWVWVMGEHPKDLSIEQILENESKDKARRLAEKEIMQTLRKADDLPNALDREENVLKAELARVELNGTSTTMTDFGDKPNSYSPYDDLMEDSSQLSEEPMNNKTTADGFSPILAFGRSYLNSEVKRSPLPFAPQEIYDNLNNLPPQQPGLSTAIPPPYLRQFPSKARPQNGNDTIANAERLMPPPVPEKPPSLRRTISNSLSNGLPGIEQIAFNTIRSYIPPEEFQKRQSKIFEQLQEQRDQLEREAESEARRQEVEYEEREKKAREADESIRRTVQKAREQHRKNLRTSDALLPFFRDSPNGINVREALRAMPRPPKPRNRQAIIQWFRESELAQWKGHPPAEWFHGIISREEAERLLQAKPIGSFLVRVTERIFGYTVSYQAEDGTKNFLVERIQEGYQFMGTNQMVHPTLGELIAHHQGQPITAKGGELLREPVGQEKIPPDYEDLFSATFAAEKN